MRILEYGIKANKMDPHTDQLDLLTSHVIEGIRAHRSVRSFRPDPVPDEMIERIVEAGQWASSTCFRQVYSVIVIKDPQTKGQLRQFCGGQKWVEDCPVFLAFCVDLNRLDDLCMERGKHTNLEHTETFLSAAVDVALVMQNVALAAESLGLGIVMIGGLRDNPREVIKLLKLPHGVFGLAGMCLGYAEVIPNQRPRLPLAEVLHWETYSPEGRKERLAEYDQVIRSSGVYKAKNSIVPGWTDVMARTTSKPPPEEGRYQLREILNEQGFEMK